jgi:hypothetical protein
MSLQEQLVSEIRRLLRQGVALVEELDDTGYRSVEQKLSTSSIGAHVRHCIDHVQAFLGGVPEGRIDYDRRERDERVEVDREHASARLAETGERLGAVVLDGVVRLRVRMDAPGGEGQWAGSTVERELQSLVSHTVHHYALIAILVRAQGRRTADGFGVARSTLDYWGGAGRAAAGVASQSS